MSMVHRMNSSQDEPVYEDTSQLQAGKTIKHGVKNRIEKRQLLLQIIYKSTSLSLLAMFVITFVDVTSQKSIICTVLYCGTANPRPIYNDSGLQVSYQRAPL